MLMGSAQAFAGGADIHINGGISTSSAAGSTSTVTYGGGLDFMLGSRWSIGAEALLMPSAGVAQNFYLGKLEWHNKGFFIGAVGGIMAQTITILSTTTNTTMYGPTLGMYFGNKVSFGVEGNYLLSSGTALGSGLIQGLAGLKFML